MVLLSFSAAIMKFFTRFCIIVLCAFAVQEAFAQSNVIQLRNGTANSMTLLASTGGHLSLTFPSTNGSSGQALTTDGSGILSWSTPASSINSLTDAVSNATSNTLILGLEPAGLTVNALRNTSVGLGALTAIDQGDDNTVLGFNAGLGITTGSTNTLVGTSAGSALTTTSGNVMIGFQAGSQETGSNKLYIANSNTASPLIAGDFSASTLTFNGATTTTGTTTMNGRTVFSVTTAGSAVTATGTSGAGAPDIIASSFTTSYYAVTVNAVASTAGFVQIPAGTTEGQVLYLKLTFASATGNPTVTVVNSDNTNTILVYDGTGADVIVAHLMYTTAQGWIIWSAIEYDNP